MKVKGIKNYHEDNQRKHLNNEQKNNYGLNYTVVSLLSSITLGACKRQGVMSIDIKDIVPVALYGGIGIVLVVEVVIKKV